MSIQVQDARKSKEASVGAAVEGPSRATIYRMVMEHHICPYGLKALHLLRSRGYEVEDIWLRTREDTDAFKAKHGVATTPQTFIDGERIGGHDDLRRFLGLKVRDPKALTYTPIIALFSMTALMALAASYAVAGSPFTIRAAEWFIGFSMALLAFLKLRDIESFSSMFLNYDLLAKRWVPYATIYPFAEAAAGILMISGALSCPFDSDRALHRRHRRGLGDQGGLYRQARTQMRVRRRRQQRAARLYFADRKSDDDCDGSLDVGVAIHHDDGMTRCVDAV